MTSSIQNLLKDVDEKIPLQVGSKRRVFTRRLNSGIKVSGDCTVESVARTIGMDESTLWDNAEKLMRDGERERMNAEEADIQQLVNNFIQHVPMNTYDPTNLCGRACLHGGESEKTDHAASWFVCFSQRYQLYGCVVHGTVHRCGIHQCHATRVDREAKRFCMYSNAYLGSDLDFSRHEFDKHSAYYEVTAPATYIKRMAEQAGQQQKGRRKMDQSEGTAEDLLIPSNEKMRRVRRRVRRRRKLVPRVLGNVASTCYSVVSRLFYNDMARIKVVERMLETAKREADAALQQYHESLVVRIKGQDTGIMYMCDAVKLFTILSSPFRCLRNLVPAYPWPDPPCVLLPVVVEKCEETTDEIESVCQMISIIWNTFQSEGCVTSSSQSLINLACYLVFSLGNSNGIVWDEKVLYPSTPFLFKYAPSNDWSVHIEAFVEDGLALSVSNITEGRKEYQRSMRQIQTSNPAALETMKNSLRGVYETWDEEDEEVEGLHAEKTQAPDETGPGRMETQSG
ncbi:MAG: hypothetical protein AB7P49_04145 [Bdellovibrionales bacterium]